MEFIHHFHPKIAVYTNISPDHLNRHDTMELASLNDLVTIAGSLVLGLAVSGGALDVAMAWEAIRLENDFQARKWGEDAEAAAHAARLFEEFKYAALFLNLHRTN